MKAIWQVAFTCLAIIATAVSAPGAPGLLNDLRVEQPITHKDGLFEPRPSLRITFTLAKRADVTVQVARHLARSSQFEQWQYEYLPEPYPVRRLSLGKLAAGTHTATWDGLNEKGEPVAETCVRAIGQNEPFDPAKLTEQVPVDTFRVTVQAGKESLAANIKWLRGFVPASRALPHYFLGSVRDSHGNIVVTDRAAWRGMRYSPSWRPMNPYPDSPQGHGSSPVECYDAAADGQGNVYIMAPPGLYKFDANGAPAAWSADDDCINYPYPSSVRNVLGWRLDANAKGKREYTFGPGGGGARKYWDSAEQIGKPGFAFQWGGMAVDAAGSVYLARLAPDVQVWVFAPSGKFSRPVPVPPGVKPVSLRFGVDGALWMGGEGPLARVNAQTGAVEKTIQPHPGASRSFTVGPDGTIYTWGEAAVARFSPVGEPMPFAAKDSRVREDGRVLNISLQENKVAEGAAGYAQSISGVVGGEKGDFYLCTHSREPIGVPKPPYLLLHFGADGAFAPDDVSASIAPHLPGNVFAGDTPATVELHVNSISSEDRPLAAQWTLIDIDGKQTQGTVPLLARAGARQSLALTVPATQMGHYRLNVELRQGDRTIAGMQTQLARIQARKLEPNTDSPFGMNWGQNFYLMGLAGVKYERTGIGGWDSAEPRPGVYFPYPDLPEAVQFRQSYFSGYYSYARRWGVELSDGFYNGEPWLAARPPGSRIHSYDALYRCALQQVDLIKAKGWTVACHSFWNEPNFFWQVPGPFGREFYALAGKHLWCIVKARDKDATFMYDGDAGSAKIMQELAGWGAAGCNDAVSMRAVKSDGPPGVLATMIRTGRSG